MKRTIRDLFTAVTAVVKRSIVLRRSMIIAWQAVGLCACYLLAFELRFAGGGFGEGAANVELETAVHDGAGSGGNG